MKTRCIDEETIMDYLEGRLHEKQRSKIERHLVSCRTCLDQVSVCGAMMHGDLTSETAPAPTSATKKAIEIIHQPPPAPLLNRVAGYVGRKGAQGKTSILEKLHIRPEPLPSPVRSTRTAVGGDLVLIRKTFTDLEVEIEIEKIGKSRAHIRVDLSKEGNLSKPVRVTLFQKEREMASSLLSHTAVLFENIPFGTYVLVFSRNGEKLGEYPFEIRESCNSKK